MLCPHRAGVRFFSASKAEEWTRQNWPSVARQAICKANLPRGGDGAMGFWAALDEVYPTSRQQRCWQHKTMNVLNCLPKLSHLQPMHQCPRGAALHRQFWRLILPGSLGFQQLDPYQPLGCEIVAANVFDVRGRDFRAPPPARGKCQHQPGPMTNAAVGIVATGQYHLQHVAGDRLW